MRRVVYISRSLMETDAEVDAIVRTSSMRNAAAGISGILWVGDREFVQALEGDEAEVGETLQRITNDPRHTDIEIVCDCVVHSRMFGSWAMVRSDDRAECTFGTAYLIGYAARQHSHAARRVADLLLMQEER